MLLYSGSREAIKMLQYHITLDKCASNYNASPTVTALVNEIMLLALKELPHFLYKLRELQSFFSFSLLNAIMIYML